MIVTCFGPSVVGRPYLGLFGPSVVTFNVGILATYRFIRGLNVLDIWWAHSGTGIGRPLSRVGCRFFHLRLHLLSGDG